MNETGLLIVGVAHAVICTVMAILSVRKARRDGEF